MKRSEEEVEKIKRCREGKEEDSAKQTVIEDQQSDLADPEGG